MMATRRVEIGPTGDAVRRNIARVRNDQRLTLRQLADKLSTTDRPLSYTTLSQIENGARRVDVDDLLALAAVLAVAPARLLMPGAENPEEHVDATGFGEVGAGDLWSYLIGEDDTAAPSSSADVNLNWVLRSRPRWAQTTYTEGDLKTMISELLIENRESRRGDD